MWKYEDGITSETTHLWGIDSYTCCSHSHTGMILAHCGQCLSVLGGIGLTTKNLSVLNTFGCSVNTGWPLSRQCQNPCWPDFIQNQILKAVCTWPTALLCKSEWRVQHKIISLRQLSAVDWRFSGTFTLDNPEIPELSWKHRLTII